MRLKDRVRQLRDERGLTQEALARRCELSVGTIRKIEQGDIEDVRWQTIRELAKAFGLTLDQLVKGLDA
jgi:transcriptional regulator with XRE-family HTH domain